MGVSNQNNPSVFCYLSESYTGGATGAGTLRHSQTSCTIILDRKGQQSDNLLRTATGDGGQKERKKPPTEPGRESLLSLSISFPDIYRERRTQGDKAACKQMGSDKDGLGVVYFPSRTSGAKMRLAVFLPCQLYIKVII